MRAIVIATAIATLIGVSACQNAETAPAPAAQTAAADPVPSDTMKETFTGCTWGKVQGATLSIWSYACNPEGGSNTHLVADDSLPGFAIEGTYDGETSRSPVIVAFKKAADAPVEAILNDVRAKSPGLHTAQCGLTPVSREGLPAATYYEFAPVGEVKTRWDAYASTGDEASAMDAPCGDLGPQMSGDHVFKVLADDPTTVVFIDFGSEIQIFDIDTLRANAPAA